MGIKDYAILKADDERHYLKDYAIMCPHCFNLTTKDELETFVNKDGSSITYWKLKQSGYECPYCQKSMESSIFKGLPECTIDVLLAHTVSFFNKNGYFIRGSCSGYLGRFDPYINFIGLYDNVKMAIERNEKLNFYLKVSYNGNSEEESDIMTVRFKRKFIEKIQDTQIPYWMILFSQLMEELLNATLFMDAYIKKSEVSNPFSEPTFNIYAVKGADYCENC